MKGWLLYNYQNKSVKELYEVERFQEAAQDRNIDLRIVTPDQFDLVVTHKNDRRNIRSLELIEAKVHRLSMYYKKIGRIPKNWKYKSVIAQLE